MIKVKEIGYKKDDVQATVEYDLDGETHSFTVYAKVSKVSKMTPDDLKTYLRGRVSSKRVSKVKGYVDALFKDLIDVDIEEN